MVQRYYSSQVGRFLIPDPYTTTNGLANPQSWNRYSYVENDPINFLDPSGRCKINGEQQYQWDCPPYWPPEGDQTRQRPRADSDKDQPHGGAGGPLAPGAYIPPGLRGIVSDTVDRAKVRLSTPDCAALFGGTIPSPLPFGTFTPSEALGGAWENNRIRATTFADTAQPDVGAATMNGAIYLATNRYFFTGILWDGTPVTGVPEEVVTVFSGMTNYQVQEAILIHELLHLTGIVGEDNKGQTITLGNGQVVQGSRGVTQAVREQCFR